MNSANVNVNRAVTSTPTFDLLIDVYNWMVDQEVTPYPCKPGTKATIWELSTAAIYGERAGDSFFNPTAERLKRIKHYWASTDLSKLTPDDVSISVQCAVGYNKNRPVTLIDVDDLRLVDALTESEVLAKCFVVKGAKGCKLGCFADTNGARLNSPQWFSKESMQENKPIIELINNKHGVVWGRHPNDVVYYKLVRGLNEPIPTLGWGDILSEVLRIAGEYGLKTREQFALIKTNGSRKRRDGIGDDSPVSLRDVYTGKGTSTTDGVLCPHPIHGSTTGVNLHLNYRDDKWYCFRCKGGGGPLELKAVLMGLLECSDAGHKGLTKAQYRHIFNELQRDGVIQHSGLTEDLCEHTSANVEDQNIVIINGKRAPLQLPDIPIESITGTTKTLHELIVHVKRYYYVKEDYAIIAPCCIAVSNFTGMSPDIYGIVAPSGSLKTGIIRIIGETQNQFCYPMSTVTENSFVSGLPTNIDTVPLWRGRLVTIKDLTSLLSRNKDVRAIVFADFRELTDGYIHKEFGNGVKKEYHNVRSTILFGCTSEIERYQSMHHNLGSRILFVVPDSDPQEARRQSVKNRTKEKTIQTELHREFTSFLPWQLDRLNAEGLPEFNENQLEAIGKGADFLAVVRTPLHHSEKTGEISDIPEPEFPTRIMDSVAKLGEVHAFLFERNSCTDDDVNFALRIIADNIPRMRLRILASMPLDGSSESAAKIAEKAQLPTAPVSYTLKDLVALGVCERESRESKLEGDRRSDSYHIALQYVDVLTTLLHLKLKPRIGGGGELGRYNKEEKEKEGENGAIYAPLSNSWFQFNGDNERSAQAQAQAQQNNTPDVAQRRQALLDSFEWVLAHRDCWSNDQFSQYVIEHAATTLNGVVSARQLVYDFDQFTDSAQDPDFYDRWVKAEQRAKDESKRRAAERYEVG